MKIKCGRREFEVTEKDRILNNGAIYQLITQYYHKGFEKVTPVVAKSTFDKLLKSGKIRLSSNRWHGCYNVTYPLYEFVIEQTWYE